MILLAIPHFSSLWFIKAKSIVAFLCNAKTSLVLLSPKAIIEVKKSFAKVLEVIKSDKSVAKLGLALIRLFSDFLKFAWTYAVFFFEVFAKTRYIYIAYFICCERDRFALF